MTVPDGDVLVPDCRDSLRLFLDRFAFAGKGAFIHLKVGGKRHAHIGGHIIARLQKHNVARRKLGGGYADNRPIPTHLRMRRGHFFEGLKRFFRTVFLNNA